MTNLSRQIIEALNPLADVPIGSKVRLDVDKGGVDAGTVAKVVQKASGDGRVLTNAKTVKLTVQTPKGKKLVLTSDNEFTVVKE